MGRSTPVNLWPPRPRRLALRAAQPEAAALAPAFTNLALDQLARRYGRSRLELGGLESIPAWISTCRTS